MTYHSQFGEDAAISGYFATRSVLDRPRRLLDLGAFDGQNISNSRFFIENGWHAVLVEPAPKAFNALLSLYNEVNHVHLVHAAVGKKAGLVTIWDRDEYSTTDAHLRDLAPGYWRVYHTAVVDVSMLIEAVPGPYDFISIDTEGCSLDNLEAMPLEQLDTSCVCVEYNHLPDDRQRVIDICARAGLTHVVLDSSCNLVMGRP